MKVKELGQSTNFTVSAIDEITGEEMPDITFSVTLIEEDFIALSENSLLSKHLPVHDVDIPDSPMMQKLEEGL